MAERIKRSNLGRLKIEADVCNENQKDVAQLHLQDWRQGQVIFHIVEGDLKATKNRQSAGSEMTT